MTAEAAQENFGGGTPADDLQRFWAALGEGSFDQRRCFDPPDVPYPDPIYCIRTKPGFIFDDSFWDVFHRFPFHICHVAYYGPERFSRSASTGVFELRFKPASGSQT